MSLMRVNIYKTWFVILLIAITGIPVFEVHFIIFFISFLLLFLSQKNKISNITVNFIFLLFLILCIGAISSIFYHKSWYDWVRDFLYFLKPILGILVGYFLLRKIRNPQFLFKSIIYISLVFAVSHIFNVLISTDFSTDSINDIRNTNGISNLLELLALVLLIGSYKYDYLNVVKNRTYKKTILLLIMMSVVLYFSRTMFIAFFIMSMALLGYTRLTTKGLKYGLLFLIFIGGFYIYLFSIEIERDQPGIESFLYKMKIAPSEIFSPSVKINVENHEELWDHWRAYEADRALTQMNQKKMSYLAGFGFGALVDLKFKAPLNEEGMRHIPILHNGYVYVLFKTGIIGLIVYFIFLGLLYFQSYKNKLSPKESILRNLIASIGLYFLFSSLITTGIYNSHEIYSFILGGILYLLIENKSTEWGKER